MEEADKKNNVGINIIMTERLQEWVFMSSTMLTIYSTSTIVQFKKLIAYLSPKKNHY